MEHEVYSPFQYLCQNLKIDLWANQRAANNPTCNLLSRDSDSCISYTNLIFDWPAKNRTPT